MSDPTPRNRPVNPGSLSARLQALASDPRAPLAVLALAALAVLVLVLAAGGIHITTGPVSIRVAR